MTIHDLIILGRLDRIIRREILRERVVCEKCGLTLRYSPNDTVWVHENGAYPCGS